MINSQVAYFLSHSIGELHEKKAKKVYRVKLADSWKKRIPIGRVNDNSHALYCIPCEKSVSW